MIADIKSKNMDKESPILIRLFKEESELEVWKQTTDGSFALLKTYPICKWSGDLGPKKREGDRQAPEGFYTIPQLLPGKYGISAEVAGFKKYVQSGIELASLLA